MKLYNYSFRIINKSRGYSFDHPTNMKMCISKLFQIMMKEQDVVYRHHGSVYHKTLIIRRDLYPMQLLDVDSRCISIQTHLNMLNSYQRNNSRYKIDNTLPTKIGLLFLYEGKWK